MATKDEGGPAFAAIATGPAGDVYHQIGMTLRDWFAGQVLMGICASGPTLNDERIVREAYTIADAMIAERSKP